MTDVFAALTTAAEGFETISGVKLADHLWTHTAPFHSGEVASTLIRCGRPGHPAPGFLLLYATDVRLPLLYLPRRQPLRVQTIQGTRHCTIGGPFLALVVCEVAPDGQAQAMQACAIPIYRSRRFVPVNSDLGRDVLRALEHLQVTLDAYGAECTIRCEPPFSDTMARHLTLSFAATDHAIREIRLEIAGDDLSNHSDMARPPVDFLVTSKNWADGTFTRWLAGVLA